ncbi:acyltransferase family protein [uncultured Tenacibaculum sp.]|uniref:acyltransferase family protein n=1 Tax=uncultured Tenacibaculum sp. TaxID=174713 RepID=UPI00260C7C2F|nr:acyltransferase family protein [uncultured Tenacibaculum sp.]
MTLRKTERIHSLDALRAIMMLLGIVLHAALTYNVTNHGNAWSIKDPNTTHLFSDFLVLLIHSFRMQIFFVVAGFFGAMLYYERQPKQMIKNRFSRIVLPFITFLLLLWPFIVFAYSYTNATFSHQVNALDISLNIFSSFASILPKTTSHLWFLYYLSWITATMVIFKQVFKNQKINDIIHKRFEWIIQRPFLRILCFSILIFITLYFLGTSMIQASVSLILDKNTYVYFLVFYVIGWILYSSKHHLESFMQYDWLFTLTAVILSIIQGLIIQIYQLNPSSNSILLIALSAIIVCLFTSGIIGLFVRYASHYSARMRYISDSSYWVYLIHLPLTAIIPAFIWNLPLPAVAKFLIVVIFTTIICFSTYHYFVRNTFIGKFLNGRKYPRK